MTRVSQIISVVGGVKSDVTAQMDNLERNISQGGLVYGISRTYRSRFEDGAQLPPESTKVQVTADGTLATAEQLMGRLLDVTRTLDEANARAASDVVVDGQVILPSVTTSHLLYLQRELDTLHAFVSKFPTLDQAEVWTDEGTDAGIHKTLGVETASTDKVPYNHELVKAQVIDGHLVEPKVQVMARDEVRGYWTSVKFSGALDPRRKRQILDRITKLRDAVKFAREEANSAECSDVREGKRVFDYVLRG